MKKIFIIFILFVSAPFSAYAGEFYLSSIQGIPLDGEGVVSVHLDTKGERANAVSGRVNIPEGLRVARVLSGGSAIVLWIEAPRVIGSEIAFSGITPGGFQGDRELFSFVASASVPGNLYLRVADGEVRKNDTEGTVMTALSRTLALRVSSRGGAPVAIDDVMPPESFKPVVASDPNLFDGAPFVSFAAQDKGSGIAGYEAAHSFFLSPGDADWEPIQSPFAVPEDALYDRIYIRAADAAGNMTVVSVAGPGRYTAIWIGVILTVLALCVLSFTRRYFSSRL